MNVIPDPKRRALGFTRFVRVAFAFVETEFAYQLAREDEPTLVTYESRGRFLNVYHSRGGYRVGAEIGRLVDYRGKQVQQRVSLVEIVGSAGDEVAVRELDVPAESREIVEQAVKRVARLVDRYGRDFLRGEARAYERIDVYRADVNQRRADEGAALWKKRQAAHNAWKAGDVDKAARLLRGLPGLSTEERRIIQMSDEADNAGDLE